jgi:hypothetical protein
MAASSVAASACCSRRVTVSRFTSSHTAVPPHHRLALRLRPDEFEGGGLSAGIQTSMDEHGLAFEGNDLIVYLGGVDNFVTVGVEAPVAGPRLA